MPQQQLVEGVDLLIEWCAPPLLLPRGDSMWPLLHPVVARARASHGPFPIDATCRARANYSNACQCATCQVPHGARGR